MKKISYLFALLLATSFAFMACSSDDTIPVESVTMYPTTYTLPAGSTVQLSATVKPANADNPTVHWSSSNRAVATVDENGLVTALSGGMVTITARAGGRSDTSTITVEFNLSNSNEGVIINDLRWATRNLAAPGELAVTVTALGMFYQWNRPTGWAGTGIVSGWNNTPAAGTEWTAENDPCALLAPAGTWRVPTREDFQSLRDAWSAWTTINDIHGRLFGTAPNQIFLRAAGWRYGGTGLLGGAGTGGRYWSSTQQMGNNAFTLYFNSSEVRESSLARENGFSIRCVADKQ